MTTFEGKAAPSPTVTEHSAAPSALARLIVLAAFALLAALVAAHFWINIIRVPMLRPIGPLFGAGPASKEGWAPWHASPLFAAALTLLILHLYFRRVHRWTLFGLAGGGLFAVLFGGWAAFWVKNIGYTWYFVPNATTAAILAVQPQMASLALGRALHAFVMQAPLLLAIGAVAGAVIALVLRVPLRHLAAAAPAGSAAQGEQARAVTPQTAGWTARLLTAAPMALLAGAAASFGTSNVAIVAGPVTGLIWLFVSFRGGRYVFRNVLIGSAIIAALAALPLAIAAVQPPLAGFGRGGGGSDLQLFVLYVATRLPVFVLVSVALIKVALLMSRAKAYLSGKPVPLS